MDYSYYLRVTNNCLSVLAVSFSLFLDPCTDHARILFTVVTYDATRRGFGQVRLERMHAC